MKEARLFGADIPAMGMALVITDESHTIQGFALVEIGGDGQNLLRTPSGEPLPKIQEGWYLTECRYNPEDGLFYPPVEVESG